MAAKTLNTYVTGFCLNGHHEGEQHRNYRGEPMEFCRGQWMTNLHGSRTQHKCGCPCHAGITEVFKSVGRERVWPESGKWWRADDEGLQPVEKFVRPWEDPTLTSNSAALKSAAEVVVVTANQREEQLAAEGGLSKNQMRIRRAIMAGILPPNPDYIASGPKKGADTRQTKLVADGLAQMGLRLRDDLALDGDDAEAGKRLRTSGQLEREVKEVCDLYTIGLMPEVFQLTASKIAKAIDSDNPPSTGAITNVLKRWDEVGFAVHATKPHRFDGYTPKGIELGVERLYAQKGRAERYAALTKQHTFHRRR